MKHNLSIGTTNFFVTAPLPCPYLHGKMERRLVTEVTGGDEHSLHDTLSRVGFRRSHGIIYAPICQDCVACLAVRTVVDKFAPSASQRRVQKINKNVMITEGCASATYEQYMLFSEYQDSRHTGSDMATMDFVDYKALIEETPVKTLVLEFRLLSGSLIGVCLVDELEDGLSAVYSFFNPTEKKRSLGTYIILSLIDVARQRDLPYVYLGYWVSGSQKMAYKDKFKPVEFYDEGRWRAK